MEPVASDVGAAARMRRLNLAWLLGGVILLAASVSCNRTFQGEDLAPGGLRRRRNALGSWWKRARRALLRALLDSLSGFDRRTNQLGHPGSVPKDVLETTMIRALPISTGRCGSGRQGRSAFVFGVP